MRILFLSNEYPQPLHPGKGTFNAAMIRALSTDHLVHVVCPVAWTEKLQSWLRRGPKALDQIKVLSSNITARYPTFWYTPKLLRTSYHHFLYQSIKHSLERDIREFRPDAILSYWAHPDGAVAVRIAHEHGLPAITMVGGSDVLVIGRSGPRRNVILNVLREADAVVAVSEDIANNVVKDGIPADKVHVIRRGVDTRLFYPGDQQQARRKLGITHDVRIIVGVGRLASVKDWPNLINSCELLLKQGISFCCAIIGEGALRPQLQQLIDKKGLQQHVQLLGGKSQVELGEWYRAADVIALSSVSEGIPNVLIEAGACDLPFVATKVGGIPEILDTNRDLLVPPRQPQAMAQALTVQLNRSEHRPRSQTKSMSWAESAERLADVIQSCRQTKSVVRGSTPAEMVEV